MQAPGFRRPTPARSRDPARLLVHWHVTMADERESGQPFDPRGHVDSLVRAVLKAAEPGAALARHWPDELRETPCHVLAVGKAAGSMLAGVARHSLCDIRSAVVLGTPGVSATMQGASLKADVFEGDHPVPTERNVRASERIREFVAAARERFLRGEAERLVVLLSGGASALLSLPAEGVTLDDCREVTEALLKAGAPIEELNAVRKHLETLKGGGLARLAAPMPVWTLILSDVIGDDLSSIGSGPTCADPTTFADALRVIEKRNLRDAAAGATRALEDGAAGRRSETVKPGDPTLANVRHRIIGNNAMALDAAARRAQEMGFHVVEVTPGVRGEAREVGRTLARRAMEMLEGATRPCAVLMGGETTVTVKGKGRGGRNQEAALAAAIELSDCKGEVVVASFSTDGIDGVTDAAGAVAHRSSVAQAAAAGVDAHRALAENDSYRFFDAAGGLIVTGPTGTNVNDVMVGLVYPG